MRRCLRLKDCETSFLFRCWWRVTKHGEHCWLLTGCILAALQVMRRYHIQDRDDYKKYNKLSGMITKLVNLIKQLDSKDEVRIDLTDQLLEK